MMCVRNTTSVGCRTILIAKRAYGFTMYVFKTSGIAASSHVVKTVGENSALAVSLYDFNN